MSVPVFDMLPAGIDQVSFDLVVPRSVNRMMGRRTEGLMRGTAYWQAQYQATFQNLIGYGKADAWIRRVMSRGGVFKAHDVFRPRPIEAGASALTWSPDLTTITDARHVVIAGVANGFQFREGDYVAFRMSDLVVSLHSIEADAVASGGGVVSLSIDPVLDTGIFTTAAVPIFEKPYCLMQPFDWSGAKSWSSRNPSFSAQEVFFYEPEDVE